MNEITDLVKENETKIKLNENKGIEILPYLAEFTRIQTKIDLKFK